MDVINTNQTIEIPTEQGIQTEEKIQLPFPQTDYDKNGNLKKLRKTPLKKLLKYEFRAIFPHLLTLVVALLALSVIFATNLRLAEGNDKLVKWGVMTGTLYAFCNLGVVIVAYTKAHNRYKTNFFGSEGYLTFSIPASAEEHLFAKHLAMIISVTIAEVAIVVGIFLLTIIMGANPFVFIGKLFSAYFDFLRMSPVHTVLFSIEIFLLWVVFIPFIPCLLGADACLMKKYDDKKKSRMSALFVLIGFVGYYVLNVLIFSSGILRWVFTDVGIHIALWLLIALVAGGTVGLFLYERKTLQKNLNLQ